MFDGVRRLTTCSPVASERSAAFGWSVGLIRSADAGVARHAAGYRGRYHCRASVVCRAHASGDVAVWQTQAAARSWRDDQRHQEVVWLTSAAPRWLALFDSRAKM